MIIDPQACTWEKIKKPLGEEYGSDKGKIYPGIRVTHIPTGETAEYISCPLELHNLEGALNLLQNQLAPDDQRALVEAISWGNANMYWAREDEVNNDTDHRVAHAILEGLKEIGWTLVKK